MNWLRGGWLRGWFAQRRRNRQSLAPRRRARRSDRLEPLEPRQLLTVTFHGGAVLPNVEIQALYYGQDWKTNAAVSQQAVVLDQYLGYLVNSPYMDMLTQAGYGVGRGTASPGDVFAINVNKKRFLTDARIQRDIQAEITGGGLMAPDANRVYIVFVEPGVKIRDNQDGTTSVHDFLGYHGAFAGRDKSGNPIDLHYAVIASPGGANGSSASQGFGTDLDQLTSVSSHEVAEAATDPNIGYKKLGWYDDRRINGGEIADIVSNDNTVLNGYVVQNVAARDDASLAPAGATPYKPFPHR